ncbi:MAG: tRNA pseudouridine(54/55) synthase Pus10 [Asgard group archaeon]|nr:tRNA pseudouridine(54/55) synthase Pus10 [Asgard group archaeon]
MLEIISKLKKWLRKSEHMFQLAQRLLLETKLCDHCFGRQFALLGFGLSNDQRNKIIKDALTIALIENLSEQENNQILLNIAESGNELAIRSLQKKGVLDENYQSKNTSCELCEGIFNRLDEYSNEIIKKISSEDFKSFLLGAKFFPDILEKEDIIRGNYQISTGESIKAEFTRELGKLLMTRMDKIPDFDTPDLTIIIDLPKQKIALEKRSLFLYGRYNKYIRTIPQTKWPCYDCHGKGCENCNFTGKRYIESIEEIIAHEVLKITKGIDSKFHGGGREDIDALMLGNGRPFVLEIREPKVRTLDVAKLERKINRYAKKKVKVNELTYANKKKVQELKEYAEKSRKTYRAQILLDKEITLEQAKKLEADLSGIQINQQTPTRVLHRRSDLNRKKMVHKVKIKFIDKTHIIAEIEGQGGLYIKELISGDSDRTKPSFSELLECNAKCTLLDVIHLHKPDNI